MNQTDTIRPLSSDACRVLAAVASQLERYDQAIRGLCVKGEVSHTKHGKFGPDEEPVQIEERLDEPGGRMEQHDVLPLLIGSEYARRELPPSHANELRVRVSREASVGESEDVQGADLMFKKEPAELVQAILHPPEFSGVVGFLLEATDTEILFSYVNGVPLPVKMKMRMRSRGIGRFRFDQETIISVRHEPCT